MAKGLFANNEDNEVEFTLNSFDMVDEPKGMKGYPTFGSRIVSPPMKDLHRTAA